jgi:hypothetical protein
MEKKQSSVEWLEQQLKERYSLINSEPLFEQAKQMEKEQIEDAYYMGDRYSCCGCYDSSTEEEAADYYNETFGGNNE